MTLSRRSWTAAFSIVAALSLSCADSGEATGASPGGSAAAGGGGGTGATGASGGTGGESAGSSGGSGGEFPTSSLIYVSTLGDDNESGKSPTEAVASLNTGMMRALACSPGPCDLAVEKGTFLGQVTLAEGVDVLGGYAPGFGSRDPAANETLITSLQPRTVIAEGIEAPTVIDGVTISGVDYALDDPADGSSSYAVWMHMSTGISFVDTTIEAGNGATGDLGTNGETTSCAALGGQGGEAFDCGGSVGAVGVADGDPVVGGGGGPAGGSNCPSACPSVGGGGVSNGGIGTDGGDGDPGAPGVLATDDLGSFTDGFWSGAIGSAGDRGFHGTGGGGGGSGGTKKIRACFGCGSLIGGRGGDGAAGGCGGGGGEPGNFGGGSFGIVLWESSIATDGLVVRGSKGGVGGVGGEGLAGAMGETTNSTGVAGAASQQCGAINYSSGGGAVGGLGGDGGPGGGGAGGNGGVSVAIALIGTAAVDEVGALTVDRGTGGMGGPGGLGGVGNDAQAGFTGAVWGQHEFD